MLRLWSLKDYYVGMIGICIIKNITVLIIKELLQLIKLMKYGFAENVKN